VCAPYHETRFTDRRKNGIAMGLGEKGTCSGRPF
jgi:hypothetical protein